MAEIQKGVVTQVTAGGTRAIIRPYGAGAALTPPLPVQQIRITRQGFTAHANEYNTGDHPALTWTESHPQLDVGDSVAFVLFEDGTGLIFDKV